MLTPSASPPSPTADDRETRIQALLQRLRPNSDHILRQMAERLVDLPEDRAFGQIEYDLRDLAHDLAAASHQTGLGAAEKKGYRGSSIACPHCQADARFVEDRPKTWLTPNGEVTAERAYYHCDHCHQGHCPFDQANGLQADRLSTGLRPLVCLAGALDSFRDAAEDILRRFSGVRLSAATALLLFAVSKRFKPG